MLAALCHMTFAQSAGDYIYTGQGRIRITTGEELVENGDFAADVSGWSTDGEHRLSADTFAVVTGAGPSGDNALCTLSKENGPAKGSCIYKTVRVNPMSTYYVSYYVRTEETFTSITEQAANTKNYQNVIFNQTGRLYEGGKLNVTESYGSAVTTPAGEWTRVAYTVTAPTDGYIAFYMYAPYIGQCFAGFSVKEARIVPDDRQAAEFVARLRKLVDDERWTEGKEDILGFIDNMNKAVADDNLYAYDELKSMEAVILQDFLDMNTVNISDILDVCDFNDAAAGQSSLSALGKWNITWDKEYSAKSRWNTRSGDAGTDGSTFLYRSIPAGNELSDSKVAQSVCLPKGRYMYSMNMMARRYLDKNNTKLDGSADIRNLKIFIGHDTLECRDVSPYEMRRYTVETELQEDGTVDVGFCMETPSCHELFLDVTELRSLDNSYDIIEDYVKSQQFVDAREQLLAQIAAAEAMCGEARYIFGKAMLSDSIMRARTVYETYAEYSAENLDSVSNQAKRLVRACSAYREMNAEYLALAAAIAAGREAVGDVALTGDKTALRQTVSDAEAYYNSLTASSERDVAALNGHSEAIAKAISALREAGLTADEMLPFYRWSQENGAAFAHSLTGEPVAVSAGASWTKMYMEGAQFAGHDISARMAFGSAAAVSLSAGAGLIVTAAKNNMAMSVVGLQKGNEVTVDWKLNTGQLYVGSGNAEYVRDDGTRAALTASGDASKVKVPDNIIANSNTDGLGGTHRTVFVMTADGTLDFFFGSASTMTVAYIGINRDASGVAEVKTGNTASCGRAVKLVRNGRMLIETPQGVFSASGARVR